MENETLREYIKRFNETLKRVVIPNDGAIMTALGAGRKPSWFFVSLINKPVDNLAKLMEMAYKEMDVEEMLDEMYKDIWANLY